MTQNIVVAGFYLSFWRLYNCIILWVVWFYKRELLWLWAKNGPSMVLSRVFRSEKRDALLIPTFLRGTRGVLAQVLFDCRIHRNIGATPVTAPTTKLDFENGTLVVL